MTIRTILVSILALAFISAEALAQRRDTSGWPANDPQVQTNTQQPAAQQPFGAQSSGDGGEMKWRSPDPARRAATQQASNAPSSFPAANSASPTTPRQPIARVTPGPSNLPGDAGQVWLDYDISPYTARVTSTNRPEQAIVDWILRETGYEAWHSELLALLNADRRTLRVYHTPEIQKQVADIVDRFVNTEAETHVFGMRVITVGKPDWRTTAFRMLRPIKTQSAGIQAWLLAKEDAALLVASLGRRSDFQEHGTPQLIVNNGQAKIVSTLRTRNYARDILVRPDLPWPGYEPQMGQVNEGYNLEFSPLLTLDGREVDAVIKCEVDQVEKMINVSIPVPTQVDRRNQAPIEVPQLISSRLHERFRWPAEQVLLISLGVGPMPVPQAPNTLPVKIPGLSPGSRGDLLVFVESKGKSVAVQGAQQGQREAGNYRGRY